MVLPVPDGWERCPGDKVDVIRRLKLQPLKPEEAPVTTTPEAEACKHKTPKADEWEPWNKPCGGCC
jgi:hypothetical protein